MPLWAWIAAGVFAGINVGFIFSAFILGVKVYNSGREWELGKLRRLGVLTQGQYNRLMSDITRGR